MIDARPADVGRRVHSGLGEGEGFTDSRSAADRDSHPPGLSPPQGPRGTRRHPADHRIHATYNNALKGGLTIVTGHLHRLAVTPWADYNGRRYGVDTGTLADPLGPQFEYLENNPTPWCSGFAVLTFRDGQLLPPELVEVIDGTAYFRGQKVA